MPRRLSGNRSKQPRNDPSSESSKRTHTRNLIPGLLRIRFLPRHDVSPSAVAFQTHRRSCNRDSIALRTAEARPIPLTHNGLRCEAVAPPIRGSELMATQAELAARLDRLPMT